MLPLLVFLFLLLLFFLFPILLSFLPFTLGRVLPPPPLLLLQHPPAERHRRVPAGVHDLAQLVDLLLELLDGLRQRLLLRLERLHAAPQPDEPHFLLRLALARPEALRLELRGERVALAPRLRARLARAAQLGLQGAQLRAALGLARLLGLLQRLPLGQHLEPLTLVPLQLPRLREQLPLQLRGPRGALQGAQLVRGAQRRELLLLLAI